MSKLRVHFAGGESCGGTIATLSSDVNFLLYTVYGYIKGNKCDKAWVKSLKYYRHVIQDSGLFTLMFGAGKGTRFDMKSAIDWQDRLIDFVQRNNLSCTCVEMDTQKVFGVKETWILRERMRKKLKNRQINVFHVEDGHEGLDELIKYTDYIAISVPEWRIIRPKEYKSCVCRIANYIKNKKPEIDIHLLGCTERDLLKKCNFCTSSDSTSWLSANKYGTYKLLDGHTAHINTITKNKLDLKRRECMDVAKRIGYTGNITKTTVRWSLSAEISKKEYEKILGRQD